MGMSLSAAAAAPSGTGAAMVVEGVGCAGVWEGFGGSGLLVFTLYVLAHVGWLTCMTHKVLCNECKVVMEGEGCWDQGQWYSVQTQKQHVCMTKRSEGEEGAQTHKTQVSENGMFYNALKFALPLCFQGRKHTLFLLLALWCERPNRLACN